METNMIHTNYGLELLAKFNQGNPLQITKICAGIGHENDLANMISMTNIKQEFQITGKISKENQAIINVRLTNENLLQGYDLTQVGVFANDPDRGEILYKIAQLERPIPIMTEIEFPDFSLESQIIEAVSNSENITVNIDPSGLVTQGDLSNYYTQEQVDQLLSTKAPKSHASTNSSAHGMATSSNFGHAKATTVTPLMDGVASIGSNDGNFARGNHRHPSDTSKADVSEVLTKTNTDEFTPTSDYHPATKKYVDDNISGGTSNYNDLVNKPKINSVELTGNKTLSNLGIAAASHSHTASDINGGSFGGGVVAIASTAYTTAQVRNSILSTANPSDGSNGDIWFQYS